MLGLCQEIHTTNGYCSSHFLSVSCLAAYCQPSPVPSRLMKCRGELWPSAAGTNPSTGSHMAEPPPLGHQQEAQHPHLTLSPPHSPSRVTRAPGNCWCFFTMLMTSVRQDDEMRRKEILQENPFSQLGNRAAAASAASPTMARTHQGPKARTTQLFKSHALDRKQRNYLSVKSELLGAEREESQAVTDTRFSQAEVWAGPGLTKLFHV